MCVCGMYIVRLTTALHPSSMASAVLAVSETLMPLADGICRARGTRDTVAIYIIVAALVFLSLSAPGV